MSDNKTSVTPYSVNSLLATVEAQIKELNKKAAGKPRTNGKFSYRYNDSGVATSLDIGTCNNIVHILNATAFLKRKEVDYNSAADVYKLEEVPVFEWNGYTVEDWVNDFTIRIFILTNGKELIKLKKDRAELRNMMDKQDKLSEIAKSYGL